MLDTSSPQYERAINCARTKWLRQLLEEVLPQLIPLTHSDRDRQKAQIFDTVIKEKFVERGLTEPAQQKNRITDVRNAIKVFNPDHPVLDVVGLSTEEWVEINSAAVRNANRSTQLIDNPDAIVRRAANLIRSNEWSEIAAGLAVITGRRVLEILKTASFDLVSSYSVLFRGAVKRRDESVSLQFEIPTLVEAPLVIDALARLRSLIDTQEDTNRQVNDKYEFSVSQKCDRSFNDLVPTRDGKNHLYTHLMRAVYVTIAAHWFCPPTVSDLEFRAYVQGHFQVLNETDTTKQTNMASQCHYWDYKISDGNGNIDGRLGIRLSEDGVEVLKAFAPQPQKASSTQDLGRIVKITVAERDRERLANIQQQFGLPTRVDANHFVMKLARSVINAADRLDISPEILLEQLDGLNDSFLAVSEAETTTELEEEEKEKEKEKEKEEIFTPAPATSEDQIAQSSPTSQILFEKMDRHFDQLNQQQQSLDNLAHAITDLVRVFSNDPTQVATLPESPPAAKPTPKSPKEAQSNPAAKLAPKPATETPSPKQPSPRQLTRQRIHQYIDAIMAFNDVLNRPHHDKWAITVSALKRLAHCGQSPVYAVMRDRQPQIDQHHALHQLTPTHNKKDHSFPKIEQVISL